MDYFCNEGNKIVVPAFKKNIYFDNFTQGAQALYAKTVTYLENIGMKDIKKMALHAPSQ